MKQNKSNGFTLIEMLVVLSLLSVVLLLVIPIHHTFITKEEEAHFLEVLQYDVLAMQNLAMTTNEQVRIRFLSDHYVTLQSTDQVLQKRMIPNNWTIQMNTMKQISFTNKGSIREAGTITMKTNETTYNFICPPGKGRCYVEKK